MNKRFLILVCAVSILASRGNTAAEPVDLLSGHLRQAENINTVEDNSKSDAALVKFIQQLSEKQKQWTATIESGSDRADYLKGIAPSTITLAENSVSSPSQAQGALKAQVSLELVLALTAYRNPDVQSAYQNLRATTRRFEQAAYLEDVVSQYRAFVREIDTKVGPQTHKEELSKILFFPSALALKGQLVDAESELARIRYRIALRKALNEAASLFFSIQHEYRKIEIYRESSQLLTRIRQTMTNQRQVGMLSSSDIQKVIGDEAVLKTELQEHEHQQLNTIANANSLMALPPDTPWGAFQEVDLKNENLNEQQTLEAAQQGNLEIKEAAQEATTWPLMLRLAETEVLPRGPGNYSQINPSKGAEAGPTRSAASTFPLRTDPESRMADFGPNVAYLSELRERVTESQRKAESVRVKAIFLAKDAHFKLGVAERSSLTLTKTNKPEFKAALDNKEKSYAAGNTGLKEVLVAAREYLDSDLKTVEARRERNQALIVFQDTLGRSVAPILNIAAPK